MIRNETDRVCFVANPRSAGGATGRRLDDVRRAADRWAARWELRLTSAPGDATAIAAAAVAEGFDAVVAVGGDGTANEVVNGLFDRDVPRRPGVAFGIVPAGTGSDLVKTLRVPRDLDEAVGVAVSAPARPIDVLSITYAGYDGRPGHRIGLNVFGFGINGEVVRIANGSSKRLGGKVTFALATAQAAVGYRPSPVAITWVDAEGRQGRWEGSLQSAFLANAQFCGGGMWVGPRAVLDDGLVDVTVIPDLGLISTTLHARRLFSGTMDHVKKVSTTRVRSLQATSLAGSRVGIDIDGEGPGTLPISAKVLEKVLLVRGLW